MLDRLPEPPIGCVGRVRKTVILADEPRQAALAALRNPALGVPMASQALAAGRDAERSRQVTCVDLYFEGVAFSWNFLQSPGAKHHPEYSEAWKVYHRCLARLIGSAQRFGRLDPQGGLQVVTPMGPRTIATSYHGFLWQPADFTRVEVAADSGPKKLRHNYSRCGLGVPLVVIREGSKNERFLEDTTPFNATAILRPSLAAIAGQAPPTGAASSHGLLEFHDPLRVKTVSFNGKRIAMATNTSAALEYGVRGERGGPWRSLTCPGPAEPGQEKLFLLEPYQPGKYPVVFVHGLFPSPRIWAEFANEILARPDLRRQVQLVGYRYPTGRPLLETAAVLRRELLALKQAYDSRGEDPGIANTAVVGHGTGGLVAKLTATYSDDRLWYSVASRPLAEINVPEEGGRDRLRDLFYFDPVPFVRRVVFVGTPHNGTQLASRTLGQWSASRAQLPASERIAHDLLIKQNPGVFKPEMSDRLPNSMDLMDGNSCLLRTIRVLCTGPQTQLHNILAVGCLSFSGQGDGMVSRKSAQHHSVSTEKQVPSHHGNLHETDEAIKELACILRRHILEANDVPPAEMHDANSPDRLPTESLMPPSPSGLLGEPWPEELRPPVFGTDELAPSLSSPADQTPRPETSSEPPSSDQARDLKPLPTHDSQHKARTPVPKHNLLVGLGL
ncbi:MAG: alpha/beta hydrolase [Pirellulaceae bacterium]